MVSPTPTAGLGTTGGHPASPPSTPPFPHLTPPQLHSTSLTLTSLNFTPFFTLRGAHLGASWPPKSTQDRPKSPLDTSFFQKREFSRNIGRRSVWSVSRAPRRPPKRPKIDPRPLQDDLQEHLFSTSFLTSMLVPLGSHFGLILAPSWVDLGSLWVFYWGPGNAPDTTPADVW